jgi:translocation and assembly module TamB
VAVILAGIALAAPVFLRTPKGLALVESVADGLPVSPVGRLEVQGLAGDPLGAFTVRRVAIRDKEGVWIEARALSLDWRPLRLAGREVRVERASAERIRILRRPGLEPPKPHQALPVTITLRNLSAVIETDPAFSVRRGAFRAGGVVQVLRDDDGASARLSAIIIRSCSRATSTSFISPRTS